MNWLPSTIALSVGLAVGATAGVAVMRWRLFRRWPVYARLRRHFAPADAAALVVTERVFPGRIRVELQRTLDRLFESELTVVDACGIHVESMQCGIDLADLLQPVEAARAVPVRHEEVNVGDGRPLRCLMNCLWLVRRGAAKCAILISTRQAYGRATNVQVHLATTNDAAGSALAREFFQQVEKAVERAESYRGKVLSLAIEDDYSGEATGIAVHTLRTVEREQLILTSRTLELVERSVIDFARQRPRLAKMGLSTRKGLLFHGPPGNGKTHAIHYLMARLADHTKFLITGEHITQLSEYMTLARLLQPSLVVLEDVDLIARKRDYTSPYEQTHLNKLLDQMDGLRPDAHVLFILTTNRPQALESALVSRPGRIDQAIEFPNPDADCRERLVRLYGKGIDVDDDVVRMTVDRADGMCAAFIRELMRRAAQLHLARDERARIDREDVVAALDEMLDRGGAMKARILGFADGAPRGKIRGFAK